MCTVRSDRCVHSCERVSGIDGEERNLSSLSRSLFAFLFFLLRIFFSLERRERVWNSLSYARTHTLLIALLPIYLLSTVHRPMKFQNCRVKRAEKTTATTIEGEKKMREKGKKERPIRWTMMMLMVLVVAERTNSDARLTERVNWWMVKGLCRVRETKERKLHFHLFLSFVHIEKENRTSTNHCRWKVIKSEQKKKFSFSFLFSTYHNQSVTCSSSF
jgi:hypothetical protein